MYFHISHYSNNVMIPILGSGDGNDAHWYPTEKVNIARLKLLGSHPRFITAQELRTNPNVNANGSKCCDAGVKHIYGDHDIHKDIRLTVREQAKALIDQATDSNLVGRIFVGWRPFI